MLTSLVYPIISQIVFWATIIFITALAWRMIFSYADPNPFSKVGRFAHALRKRTDRFVHPFADFLFLWRIDKKYAPLLTMLVAAVLAYAALQIIGNTLFIIDGLVKYSAEGNVQAVIGFVLYALLSIYILFIFLRILSSWFVFGKRSFFGFVRRVTDPVMIPFQKLIPTVGMFDISAMILLILLQLLQNIVLRAFVA
jgi:YggT family protein